MKRFSHFIPELKEVYLFQKKIVLIYLVSLFSMIAYKIHTVDYMIGYWLANYKYGFIKRGMVGHLLYSISRLSENFNLVTVINIFVMHLYVVLFYYVYYFFNSKKQNYLSYLLLFSPAYPPRKHKVPYPRRLEFRRSGQSRPTGDRAKAVGCSPSLRLSRAPSATFRKHLSDNQILTRARQGSGDLIRLKQFRIQTTRSLLTGYANNIDLSAGRTALECKRPRANACRSSANPHERVDQCWA